MTEENKIVSIGLEGELDQQRNDCLTINEEDLNDSFISYAQDYAFWGNQYAIAYKAEMEVKLELSRVEAYTLIALKEASKAEHMLALKLNPKAKAPTVGDLAAAVALDDDVVQANLDYVKALAHKADLRTHLDALAAKRDMLQSLGAMQRLAKQSDPTVRA